MGMDKLWQSKLKMDRINQLNGAETEDLPKGRFEDRHKRITIYLERDIYENLQIMRSRGFSQTRLINKALLLLWEKLSRESCI